MAYLPPRAGAMRDRLRAERKESVEDGFGGVKEGEWTAITLPFSARAIAAKGGEEVRAQRLSGISPFNISFRVSSETKKITTGDRLVDTATGVIYNIKWIGSLDGKDRFYECLAETGGVVDGS